MMTRTALFMVLLTWFLGNMDVHFLAPALPALTDLFSIPAGTAQLTISVFLLGKAISMLLWGILSERYGRKPVFIFGLVLYTSSNFLAAFSPSIHIFLMLRFIQGVAVGATLLMGRAMINDTYNAQRATGCFAWLFTLAGIFICFLPFAGGLINDYWNWQIASMLMAAYGLMLLLYHQAIQETHTSHAATSHLFKESKVIFHHPVFIGYLLISALMMAGESAFNTSASFILMKGAHFSSTQYGMVKTSMAIMHLLGTACCALLVRYYQSTQLTGIGVRLFALSAALMWLLTSMQNHILWIFIIPMMLYYFGTGFIVASATAAVVRPFPRQMAIALALTLFCQFSCSAFFSFITSLLSIETTTSYMRLLIVVSFLSLLTWHKLRHHEHALLPIPGAEAR
ncbi:MFS transporter [Legionella oakridgensis]|uniref:Arabinose efflux permease n=2 Tax=Legionella oakridgensis TaxID=29423 RepID=W0BB45_9GAMM|nr:MFS transporter [Legionella oakridgensis]AHE65911.1 arabinose efflux permease [Legionella oakridgensis ATCC 33761 = DSM 21215]KTD43765.1 drug resistance transporter, Bcr/CflA [Legionella oakridgensis]STY15842.1 drug resistance transporter, Bcr/CflA [Legionella longbeachae]